MKGTLKWLAALAALLVLSGCKYLTPPTQFISGAKTEILDSEKVAIKKVKTRRTIIITLTRKGEDTTTVQVVERKAVDDE